ncbi:hypothetical protein GCM10010435_44580 [Winogradskya consettensis]
MVPGVRLAQLRPSAEAALDVTALVSDEQCFGPPWPADLSQRGELTAGMVG